MNRLAIAVITLTVLLAGSFWAGWEWRDRSADIAKLRSELAFATAANDALVETLEAERAKAQALADIGAQHEDDRREAETVPAAVVADLRAGNLKLRREWQGCETKRLSDAATATRERDALSASRDSLAGDLVRVGRDADDQLRACQAVILADRKALVSAGYAAEWAGQ